MATLLHVVFPLLPRGVSSSQAVMLSLDYSRNIAQFVCSVLMTVYKMHASVVTLAAVAVGYSIIPYTLL